MQRQLNLMTEAQAKRLVVIDKNLVKQCRDGAMALSQTVSNTGLSQDDLAERIGKQKRVLTRAMKGSCGLPIDALLRVMIESESLYLLQYMCHQMGGEFNFISQEEREYQEMKEKLAIYEARRAAA